MVASGLLTVGDHVARLTATLEACDSSGAQACPAPGSRRCAGCSRPHPCSCRTPTSTASPWTTQEWALDANRVAALRELPPEVGVLFGVVGNDREVRHLFDAVAFLDAAPATLAHRLRTRTGNDYGTRPGELDDVLRWSRGARRLHERRGALVIPNDGAPRDALERLLELCDEVARRPPGV